MWRRERGKVLPERSNLSVKISKISGCWKEDCIREEGTEARVVVDSKVRVGGGSQGKVSERE